MVVATKKIMHFPVKYSSEGLATDETDLSGLRFLSVWRVGEHPQDSKIGFPGVSLEQDALTLENVMPYVLVYQLAIAKYCPRLVVEGIHLERPDSVDPPGNSVILMIKVGHKGKQRESSYQGLEITGF